MARNRLIKKEFFRDPKIGALPFGCRLLFQALWIAADDTGHAVGDPRLIKGEAFPYDNDVTWETVADWLGRLADSRMVVLYEVAEQKYLHIVNFLRHQTINKPSKFEYPKPVPVALPEFSASTTVVAPEHSGSGVVVRSEDSVSAAAPLTEQRERGNRKGNGKEKKRGAGAPEHFENRKIPDARFDPVKRLFVDEFERKSPSLKAPFNAGDAKMLQNLLQRQPQATADELAKWLQNAFASDDVPPLRPMFRLREFCTHAEKYSTGPLKRGGGAAVVRSAAADSTESARLESLVIT
jgi:hypothetical protein